MSGSQLSRDAVPVSLGRTLACCPSLAAATIATMRTIAHSLVSTIQTARSMHAALHQCTTGRQRRIPKVGLNVRVGRSSACIAHIKLRVQDAVRRQPSGIHRITAPPGTRYAQDAGRRHGQRPAARTPGRRSRKTGARAMQPLASFYKCCRQQSLLPSVVASSLSLTPICTPTPPHRLCFGIAFAPSLPPTVVLSLVLPTLAPLDVASHDLHHVRPQVR